MRTCLTLYLATILLSSNCSTEVPPNKCELVVSSIEAHHVVTLDELTFDSRIDSLIGQKKFSGLKPGHDNAFDSYGKAQEQADKDFANLKPQIFHVNGMGGSTSYKKEVYERILGLYVQNTGCIMGPYYSSYNNRIWTLLDHFYGVDIRNELDGMISRRSCLAIDASAKKLVQTTVMPTIQTQDTVIMSGGQPLLCSCYKMTYGTFNVEVSVSGTAKVLNYQEGYFDRECQKSVVKYLESASWQPAIREGQAFKSIVSIQLSNF